jgi:hypothetical protein
MKRSKRGKVLPSRPLVVDGQTRFMSLDDIQTNKPRPHKKKSKRNILFQTLLSIAMISSFVALTTTKYFREVKEPVAFKINTLNDTKETPLANSEVQSFQKEIPRRSSASVLEEEITSPPEYYSGTNSDFEPYIEDLEYLTTSEQDI